MTETIAPETTAIVAARLPELRDVIAKANRRLEKAGVAERFTLTVSAPYDHIWTDSLGFRHAEGRVDVSLNTPSLGYNGWTFVATLSFEEAGTVVRTVPGQECSYRPTSKVCDQCHTVRERNETFVVRNDETGEYRQVGRNCLNLFFGLKPALWIFSYNPINDFVGGDSEGSGHAGSAWRKEHVATIVAAALAASNMGRAYRPASYVGQTTKALANDILYAPTIGNRPADQEYRAQLDTMRRETKNYLETGVADEVIECAKAITGNSEYAENVRILAACEYVDSRNFGLVVSFAKVYAKAMEFQAERAAKAEAHQDEVNEFFAQVGDKIEVEGLITLVREIDGDYGVTTLIEWKNQDGYRFKWFASGFKDYEVGQHVKLRGTVKAHDEYHGRKTTMLTRCKEVS
jgi:hypothetical protein